MIPIVSRKDSLRAPLAFGSCRDSRIRRNVAVCLFVLFLHYASLAWSQALPFRDFGSDEGFQNWSSINTVMQDQDGYMWFGTMDGVYRYDSRKFTFFAAGEGLRDPTVLRLAQDGAGRIWAGTASGTLYQFTGAGFQAYATSEAMQGSRIWALEPDSTDRLWIGSERGVGLLDDSGFTDYTGTAGCPNFVLDIEVDAEQRVWIGASQGLYRYQDGQFQDITESVGLPRTVVRDIFVDAEGVLFIAADAGAFRLVGDQVVKDLGWGNHFEGETHTIERDITGALWLGSTDGVYRFGEDGIDYYSTASRLAGDNVNDIFSDAEGILWIATQGGLSSLSALDFEWYSVYEGLPGNHVSAVNPGANDTLWGGTFGNGAFYIRDDAVTRLPYPDSFPLKRLLSVIEDSQGRVWYGAMEGVAMGGAAGFSTVQFSDGQPVNNGFFLFEDSTGRIWVASSQGPAYYEDGAFHAAPVAWGLPRSNIRCIVESPDGALYFGTARRGVTRFAEGTSTVLTMEDGLASNTVFDAAVDDEGALWFATWYGLSRYADGEFTTFPIGCDTNQSRCFSVAVGGGRVYAGTTLGLVILDPETGDFEILNSGDGMLATEGTRASLALTNDGSLWIGSRNGLMRFTQADHRSSILSPPISFNEVRAGDVNLLGQSDVRLGYQQNSLRFSFQARHFANPERVSYRYRMVGADDDWSETVESTVLYPFLPPGKYVFQVLAVVRPGVESASPVQFSLQILPAFWMTSWFRCLVLLFALGTLYAIFRTRTHTMRIRNEMLTRRIEERRAAQEEQARLVEAIEQAGEAVVITDAKGVIQYVNPASVALRGYSVDECIGEKPWKFWLASAENEAKEDVLHTIESGEVWTGRMVNLTKDGHRIEVEGTISPVHDVEGRLISVVSVMRDNTREVALEQQLNQAQRMEAVGQLAGGVAHDFNNLLQAILGYMELALEAEQLGDVAREHLVDARTASERAAALVRQLLLFSRQEAPIAVSMRLADVTENLGKMLRRIIGTNIELKIDHDSGRSMVKADPGQIEQIVMNLCVNARDAMPNGGVMVMSVENETIDDAFAETNPWARSGDFVVLTVRDSGSGIPKAVQDRIFDPFFTTKERGKGTGMGLATVYGIVNRHNGFIHVESMTGAGTAFKVYLPACEIEDDDMEKHEESVAEEMPPLQKGSGTILVAEDEEMVRNIAVRMLESAGYTVLAAEDGERAYQIFDEAPDLPDVFMLDIMMPKMNGYALAELIFERRPDARILFCSGYSSDMLESPGLAGSNFRQLPKPYSPRELLRVMAELTDPSQSR